MRKKPNFENSSADAMVQSAPENAPPAVASTPGVQGMGAPATIRIGLPVLSRRISLSGNGSDSKVDSAGTGRSALR